MIDHHIHFLRFAVDRDLSELYISMVIRALAFSMVGIFVPLYLYNELKYGLTDIAKYYLVYTFIFGIFTLPASKLIFKIGIKKSILLSSPIYVIYFILLFLLKENLGLFFLVPLVLGVADALFWIAFHEDFANFSDKKGRGNEVGLWYSFSILSGLIGPLLGGVILTFLNFSVLFVLVAVLTLLSSVPLFFSKDIKRKSNFDYNFLKHVNFRDMISFIGVGVRGIVSVVFWPIFVFMILGAYLKVGSLITVVGLITAIFSFIVGRLSDTTFRKRKLIKIGSVSHSLVWFVKIFIVSQFQLVAVAFLDGISMIIMELPFSAITYNKAGKKDGSYFVFREISLCIGRALVLLLVLFTGSLISSFGFAGIASLAYMLL